MEIRAYDDLYLNTAQNILGHATDFAVLTLNIEPDIFGKALSVSSASKQFANGNPRYVAGMNGCEFAREVLTETCTPFQNAEDEMYLDKSPEFWAGWALAFYQWYSCRSFMDILRIVPLSQIINMYTVYHEMDIKRFAEHMDDLIKYASSDSRLKKLRINSGLSQSELASISGVALRQIQLFEQRQRDINKTSAITLLRLSKALHCHMEDLIEF
ncbi:DNA-binding transcriptional regulator, XRE family [Lachnospiraceae bacterium]|nr:DNA-binding transcriptional regulator, XRE family [Lachnospiraceae bacterium]